jgi:ATP-binding cassette, subfamily C, bacteriocin exporter
MQEKRQTLFIVKKMYKIILQQDQTDCGVACLLSLIEYYDGNNNLENLRRLSGTGITGTTLLGLFQAAKETGFDTEGCKADINALINHKEPCILHVITENNLQHYVVCFGTTEKKGNIYFVIGDPAKGIIHLSPDELDVLWQSKTCLTLQPNASFTKMIETKKLKKKWIKQLVKNDIQLLSIAMVLGLAIAALGVVMSLFSQRLIDDILPKRNFTKLYAGISVVLLLLLTREVFLYLRQYFLLRQAKDFNTRIIDFFYTHLLRLPKVFFDSRKTGDFTARLNDTSRIQRVISQLAGNVIIDALIIIVSTIFIFTYCWQVAVATIFFMPVLFFIIYRNNKRITEGQRSLMSSYAQTESNYISTLQGIDPIKNYNKQLVYSETNTLIYRNYQDKIFKLGKIQLSLSFTANSCGVLFLTGVLFYTSFLVMANHLKSGEMMAILGLCSSILPSIGNLALITIPVSEAKIAFDRMFEFTSIKPEADEKSGHIYKLNNVSLKNISFRFPGRSLLIRDISFEINKGKITAIMGENGCGKSTLTGILQKYYECENGNIIINHTTLLKNIPVATWRNLCAVVPQNIHIFDGTVLENIAFEKAITHKHEIIKFLQDYGFYSYLDKLPQSVFTHVGDEGINLSGGQKQMIALARALFHQPQLLILDEATSAMDRESEKFVLNLLVKLKNNMAIVFITHRLHLLKVYSDNIYIMENGKICTYGTHEKLLQSNNLYSKYWTDLVS